MSEAVSISSNDFIIVAGLHAFYSSALRPLYDMQIYLDMDEPLRRHFRHIRDTEQRGHSPQAVAESQRRREEDARRFVHPQLAHADLVFSLQPARPEVLVASAPLARRPPTLDPEG